MYVILWNLVIVGIFAYYYFLVLNMLPVIRIIHHSGILEMRIRPFFAHMHFKWKRYVPTTADLWVGLIGGRRWFWGSAAGAASGAGR